MELNEKDNALLSFCEQQPRSVGEITRYLNITPASTSNKINKLVELGLVNVVHGSKGKKTMVRSKRGDKTKEYTLEILNELNKAGGEMNLNKFNSLIPFDPLKPEQDRFNATLRVKYSPYVEHIIRISSEGKKFLKDNTKT